MQLVPPKRAKAKQWSTIQNDQRALVERLLRESKGEVGATPIAGIVSQQTGTFCSVYQVRRLRQQLKIAPAKPGAPSKAQVAFFTKYGVKFTAPSVRSEPKKNKEALPSEDATIEAFREAIQYLDEVLVQRHHLTSLSIRLENGAWKSPEFERLTVTRGTVKLK